MAKQTPKEIRNHIAASALWDGVDPKQAMIEYDEVRDAEFHGEGKLLKPTWPEQVAGADPNIIAGHRYGATLESIEVQTTMHDILCKADDLELATNALKGLSEIVKEFTPDRNPHAKVTTREFIAASKIILQLYANAREFHIKRMRQEQSGPMKQAPSTPKEAAAQLTYIDNRISSLRRVLAEDA